MEPVEYPERGNEWCAAVEDSSWWFQHRNRILLEVMRRFPPATPLYDIGGGNGVVAGALQRAGIRTIVVEPGPAGVRRARERGLEAVCATLEGADLEPGSIPAIGMFDVLEHIAEPQPFLARARTMLRPGGRLYLTVPAYATLWSAEDEYARHCRRYTARSLRLELETAQLEVELATYMFSFLPLPILLLRSIPYRLGRARPFTLDGARSDHGGGGERSASRGTLELLLGLELNAFRRWGGLPFGGSVVAVAREPTN